MSRASLDPLKSAESRLRDVMLALPGAKEEFPWGHRTGKVAGKMFAIASLDSGELHVTTKLPQSGEAALMFPFAAPTGYGLGKSGWVTATFRPGDAVPVELLAQWIHESFRAVAPQKVLKAWAAGGVAPAPKKAAAKRTVVKKTAVKKVAAKKVGVGKKATAGAARRGSSGARKG